MMMMGFGLVGWLLEVELCSYLLVLAQLAE